MPGWVIVTPYQTGAASIVVGLCVMTIIWERCPKSRRRSAKRSTFAPSKGASTSSKTQKGLGLTVRKANRRAAAVSARSPPDSSARGWRFLPGGWTRMSTPVSKTSFGVVRTRSVVPPPNRRVNSVSKAAPTAWKVSRKTPRVPSSIS